MKTCKVLNRMHYQFLMIITKTRTYDDTVYTNFRNLNVPEDGVEYESFTNIFIDSLLMRTNIICK